MQVIIRTDSSTQIGSGHTMRCLTLAKQLKENNVKVNFISRDLEGNMNDYIRSKGFEVFELSTIESTSHWNWTTEHWLEDVNETLLIIKGLKQTVDLMIVDHYSLDIQWEQQMRPFSKKIMVIDDLANRYHDCDILLDQNFYLDINSRYNSLVPDHCIKFLGPNFVLLRDEFLSIDSSKLKKDGTIKNILIFFGGADITGETLKTIYAIEEAIDSEMVVNVVVGNANPYKKEIEHFCDRKSNFNFYCQIDYMAKLMLIADLAIGSAGTASWERIYLKLPTVVTIIAENQREITEALYIKGAIVSLGDNSMVTHNVIQKNIIRILSSSKIVQMMVESCKGIMNSSIVRENYVLNKILEYK